MKNNLIKSIEIEVGYFKIKANDIVIVDVLPDSETLGNRFDFFEDVCDFNKPITSMVTELELRGIKLNDIIKKLIQSGFFNKNFNDSLEQISHHVAIIKGRTTHCRSPKVLIRDGLPDDFYLVPAEITFHLAYLISHFITKEFLNIHNMDRVFIMSDPLEKGDKIVEWDPSYNNSITTALYDNPYSGDRNAGYLFFY
ncbi:MAG: hypothetical protein WC264_00545 [Candidatus Paceibacterota bacterium]|jgi:hypothetical protein